MLFLPGFLLDFIFTGHNHHFRFVVAQFWILNLLNIVDLFADIKSTIHNSLASNYIQEPLVIIEKLFPLVTLIGA